MVATVQSGERHFELLEGLLAELDGYSGELDRELIVRAFTFAAKAHEGQQRRSGEPFWREWPLPTEVEDEGWVTLPETVARFEAAGLPLVGLIAASEDDWDRYESYLWRALEEWLAANPDDPDAPQIRERHEQSRDHYLRFQRRLLGWAIFIALKP